MENPIGRLSRVRALVAIGAVAASVPLSTIAAQAAGRADGDDLKLLNALLATAYTGVALYNGAITGKYLSAPVAVAVGQFAGDHAAHRDALAALIASNGGTAVGADSATVPATAPTTEGDLLAAALGFERQTTSLYYSSIPEFKDRTLTKTVAAIYGVDAAHVALLAEALRQNPAFPTNFVTA